MPWWLQIATSDLYNNKLVVVVSSLHIVVVAKPGFDAGKALELMTKGIDDRPEAYFDVQVQSLHRTLP